MLFFTLLPFLTLTVATLHHLPKLPKPRAKPKPQVTIDTGTIIGHSKHGVESFHGIPYAEPPVKELRFKPPKPLTTSFGELESERNPRACPQFYFQTHTEHGPVNFLNTLTNNPISQRVQNAGEDCLTINVQRPAGIDHDAKLPVVFWIFGGGFELGSTQQYDGGKFVNASMEHDQPVVWVAVNYRVGAFGFLAGKELAAEGSTNLGLRDQRLGMQWVADNIENFGGDPDKVVIWGESAGAISVYDHLIINSANHTYKDKALFRGAIMNSGSAIPVDPVTAPQAQQVYDSVVEQAGCSDREDTLECLRHKSYTRLLSAANSVPGLLGYRSIDLSYLPRPDPSDDFLPESPEVPGLVGRWAKVPVIIGDQQDEGTLFALPQKNVTTHEELVAYLASYFPGNPNAVKSVEALLATSYPDEPELGQPAGSPFNTGSANNLYPQFKRLAAVLGDVTFTLTRRVFLSFASRHVPCWSYLATYWHNSTVLGTTALGTPHGSDLAYNWGLLGMDKFPTQSIQAYYFNFIYNLDPNQGIQTDFMVKWPEYETKSRTLLEFGMEENSLMKDDFRWEAGEFLAEYAELFRV